MTAVSHTVRLPKREPPLHPLGAPTASSSSRRQIAACEGSTDALCVASTYLARITGIKKALLLIKRHVEEDRLLFVCIGIKNPLSVNKNGRAVASPINLQHHFGLWKKKVLSHVLAIAYLKDDLRPIWTAYLAFLSSLLSGRICGAPEIQF